MRGGVDALASIERAVEAAGNLKLLEQRGCACGHIVLIDGTRSDQRLVCITEGGRIKDAVDVWLGAVSRLRKCNLTGGCGFGPFAGEAAYPQPGQACLTLAGHQKTGKEIYLFDHYGVTVGNELGPVLAARRSNRSGYQAEVAPTIIGADEP